MLDPSTPTVSRSFHEASIKEGACRRVRVQEAHVAFLREGQENGLGNCEQTHGAR